MSTSVTAPGKHDVARRALITGAEAAIGSTVAAVLVAVIAKSLGVQHAKQLQVGALIFITVIGVAIGTAAWVLISRRAADPTRLLRRLVPVVMVASFIPDLAIGLGPDSWGAALTLAIAHVLVFTITVPLLALQLRPSTLGR